MLVTLGLVGVDAGCLNLHCHTRDEPSTEIVNLVAGWTREELTRRLALENLTLEESAELIAALGGEVALVEELHARSAGNPYFLLELSRGTPEGTPQHAWRDRPGRGPTRQG